MRLVIVCGLSNAKLRSKLAPLLALEAVEEIALVRREPLDEPGLLNYCPPRWLRRIVPLAEVYRFLTALWLCLRPPRPDRLIAFYLLPHGLYVEAIGWLLRIETMQLLVGTDLELALANRLLLGVVRHAHMVGVRGENSAKRLVARGVCPERVFVSPNVFDVEVYAPDASAEPAFDLIYAGSLISWKQLDILLQAVAQLRRRHAKLRLALVGDGPLRGSLEALAVRLGIESNVSFLGAVRSEEIPSYLNKARLFVMASKTEGLPMAMIEALSCGLPVVVPDVGEVTGVAHHGENAWIVSPPTVENFAQAIGTLLEDAELYARLREGALRSREFFRREYSLAATTEVWARALEIK
jgi:glycosyltransferase involved in cell wall biosynthesis